MTSVGDVMRVPTPAALAALARQLAVVYWWCDDAGLYHIDPAWWPLVGLAAPANALDVAQLQDLVSGPFQPSASGVQRIEWRSSAGQCVAAYWLAVNGQQGWLRLAQLPVDGAQLHLAALAQMVGDDAVSAVLADFSSALALAQTQLSDAVTRRDHRQLERVSHKLKSSCRLVGAKQSALLLEQLELACREGSVDDLTSRWQALQPQLHALAHEVAQQLG